MAWKTTVYLTDDAEKAYETIPRKIRLSTILRWVLLAIVMPEKEFLKKRDADPEGVAVRDYLKGKIEKLTK